MYVFDTNSFRVMENYYPKVFPSLWESFDYLVSEGRLISVEEVFKELQKQMVEKHLISWVVENKRIFTTPNEEEMSLVAKIFEVSHFQALIKKDNIQTGKPAADPWVISKAKEIGGVVVSQENYTENAAKIPNVCKYFEIDCIKLQDLFEEEGWQF